MTKTATVCVNEPLRAVSQESGATAKKAILARHTDNHELRLVFRFALDPYLTFGVRVQDTEIPPIPAREMRERSYKRMVRLLNSLHSRNLTGNAASREVAEFARAHPTAFPVLARIINKDLRVGIADTVLQVWPGLYDPFRKWVGLADPLKSEDKLLELLGAGVQAELKYDGMRVLFVPTSGRMIPLSRRGVELVGIPSIQTEVESIFGTSRWVVDGEVVGADLEDSGRVRRTRGAIDDEGLQFRVFDLIPAEQFNDREETAPLRRRRKQLRSILSRYPYQRSHVRIATRKLVKTPEDVDSFYEYALSVGVEGVMLKRRDQSYPYGKRGWFKLKPNDTYDGVVVDTYEGKGKHRDRLGGLIVRHSSLSPGGKVETRVGGGFTDKQRAELWSPSGRDSILGQTVEVRADGVHNSGRLRCPRFVRFRYDK